MKILILAGGVGKRLWPISRKNQPKQTESFFAQDSLIKLTYQRLRKSFSQKDIYVSGGQDQSNLLKKHLPDLASDNFILEPFQKGTAMAIGLACVHLIKKDPQAILTVANSDHFIKENQKYLKGLHVLENFIKKNPEYLALAGIKPQYPETGYGYIKKGKLIQKTGSHKFYKVDQFKEKPSLVVAKKYLKSNKFLWNPAWFVFKAETMLNLFQKYLPEHYQALKKIEQKIGSKDYQRVLNLEFKKLEKISIDFGIIEKVQKMAVLPLDIIWRDVGTWQAIKESYGQKKSNLIEGQVDAHDSQNNLVINRNKKKLVALLGVDDLVIVDTKDVLLICSQKKSQEVKKIISSLKNNKKYRKYL
ncbi:mannose-1-phosphate guanylyltransferase [bacterium]|nr:mannose-1-phosphate guanylyltransferase [bacterium]